jgi:hypothetical protein
MGGMGMMNGMMGDDQQDMDIFQIDASSALKSTSNLPQLMPFNLTFTSNDFKLYIMDMQRMRHH